MRILYDSRNEYFKSPFGTLREGQSCRIRVMIPQSCQTVSAALVLYSGAACVPGHGGRLSREDEQELGRAVREYALSGKESRDGGYESFSGEILLPGPGLWFYKFHIVTRNEEFSLYKTGYGDTNMEAGDLWQITCVPSAYGISPSFFGGIMYQIFPDRFAKAGSPDLAGKLTPYRIHAELTELPEYLPDENGKVLNCDFFGGNLRGIEEKLPYLASFGVTLLYLNPVFKAFSNHRYDTADYGKIDEMLGTEEDFRSLCESAHRAGIRVILDGVFSHTGSNSRYFGRSDFYADGAWKNRNSPYFSWYEFQEYPDRYTAWWGIDTLPCVKELDPSYLDYIITGEDSVLAHWMKAGADGFRLDVADELPDAFIAAFRKRMKELRPDSLLIGEVWEDASSKISYSERRAYFSGGELDSVMNYPFRQAMIDLVTGKDDGSGFRETVMSICENYPPEAVLCLMNSLSTHDTPRIMTVLGCEDPPAEKQERAVFRLSREAFEKAEEKVRLTAVLQYALPGIPCIYYGDETGAEGFEDPFCRAFFDWSRTEKNGLAEHFRFLGRLRRESEALRCGRTSVENPAAGVVEIIRTAAGETCRVTVNCSEAVYFQKTPEGTCICSPGCEEQEGGRVLLPPRGWRISRENR